MWAGPARVPMEFGVTQTVLERWHQVVRERDSAQLDALLANDVVFHSPVVHRPQAGRELARMYLTAAMHILAVPGFRYVREIVGSHDAALEFEVEIDGVLVNGIDLIRWNSAGQITDFKVMIRPLKAITLVQQQMAQWLAAH